MWVIKLGGSLMRSPALPRWLTAIHSHHTEKIIIVPGGGAFANQVRQAQARWRFDDTTAHTMAILAMEQYGFMLSGLAPALTLARTEAEMCASFDASRVAIWLPYQLLRENTSVQPSWNLTSDSLGLWLAQRLQSEHYLMIKSGAACRAAALHDYIQQGVIDAGLAEMSQGYSGLIHLLWERQYAAFHRLVATTQPPPAVMPVRSAPS